MSRMKGSPMMRIAVSFTNTLMNLHQKLVTLEEIDEIHVGCMKDHLLPEDVNKVPFEVSWLNSQPGFKSQYAIHVIDKTLCDQPALATWEYLREWLVKKDTEGKVKYAVGTYPELCRKLLKEGHEVWYHGEWQKAENFYWAEA